MKKGLYLFAVAAGLIFTSSSACAGSAIWLANPSSGDWNTMANWTMGGPPNGPADMATFQSSSVTDISISRPSANTYVELNGINFSAGGDTAYTLNVHEIYLSGSGIMNDSGLLQNFVALGGIVFGDYARAGDNTTFTVNYGPSFIRPELQFYGHATAGSAAVTVRGSELGENSSGGLLAFNDYSSAESATIVVNGSAFRHHVCPPGMICIDYPSPVGVVVFAGYSTAGNATVIANGGINGGDGGGIAFGFRSKGGTARIEVFGNARLDISNHSDTSLTDNSVTIGSLEGDGLVALGQSPSSGPLIVGSNNLSTDFSGVMDNGHGDPGPNDGTNGALTKIGVGTLTLSGTNAYTGPTTVNGGTLKVEGSITSPVTANNGGTLAGSGTTQVVTVNSGGVVAPGAQILHSTGNYAQNAGGVLKIEVAGADPSASGGLDITGSATVDGTIEIRFVNGFLPGSGQVFKLINVAGAFTGSFARIIFPDLRAGFQFQAEFVNGAYQITALNDGVAATGFLNISTRLRVGIDDDALIGGFIITGNPSAMSSGLSGASKKVIIRAIGPSLSPLPGRLSDPTLELRDNAGGLLFSNDNWVESPQAQQIIDTGIPPSNDHEAAIVATLAPGSYTAIMRGANGTTGIGVVEVYDLAQEVGRLANISSRGFVETVDNVMIGGFIAGNQAMHVLVRALGPSLAQAGVPHALADPTLELHNAQGAVIAFNDDWQDTDQAAIEATGIPPTDEKESAILATLAPGNYSAIARGRSNTTGVGLVEFYNLQ